MSAPTRESDLLERLKAKVMRPFRVIIHDDPVHTYHEVALAVQRTVPGKSYEEGWAIATAVDTTGMGIVTVCPKEIAEYYRERLEQSYGLTSTIEPA